MNNYLDYSTAPALNIEEGCEVRDFNEDTIGKVKAVRYADDRQHTEPSQPTMPVAVTGQPLNLLSTISDALSDQPAMPKAIQSHLLSKGYIRIERGLLHSDVFATIDQVAANNDNVIYLNVTRDELISF